MLRDDRRKTLKFTLHPALIPQSTTSATLTIQGFARHIDKYPASRKTSNHTSDTNEFCKRQRTISQRANRRRIEQVTDSRHQIDDERLKQYEHPGSRMDSPSSTFPASKESDSTATPFITTSIMYRIIRRPLNAVSVGDEISNGVHHGQHQPDNDDTHDFRCHQGKRHSPPGTDEESRYRRFARIDFDNGQSSGDDYERLRGKCRAAFDGQRVGSGIVQTNRHQSDRVHERHPAHSQQTNDPQDSCCRVLVYQGFNHARHITPLSYFRFQEKRLRTITAAVNTAPTSQHVMTIANTATGNSPASSSRPNAKLFPPIVGSTISA